MIEHMLTPLISERFIKEEKYRKGHIQIIKPLPNIKIMGVHIPDLKALSQKLVKENKGMEIIKLFNNNRSISIYEEKIIWGMIINRLKVTTDERLEMFKTFIPIIDNWAVCDTFCSDAKWLRKAKTETKELVWNFLMPYFYSDREFEVRFAIIFSLAHYLDEEHLDQIFSIIEHLEYDKIKSDYNSGLPYYVNMAVAWFMATALYKFPERTRKFANSGKCPEHIIKLYIRKSRESVRTKNMSAL